MVMIEDSDQSAAHGLMVGREGEPPQFEKRGENVGVPSGQHEPESRIIRKEEPEEHFRFAGQTAGHTGTDGRLRVVSEKRNFPFSIQEGKSGCIIIERPKTECQTGGNIAAKECPVSHKVGGYGCSGIDNKHRKGLADADSGRNPVGPNRLPRIIDPNRERRLGCQLQKRNFPFLLNSRGNSRMVVADATIGYSLDMMESQQGPDRLRVSAGSRKGGDHCLSLKDGDLH